MLTEEQRGKVCDSLDYRYTLEDMEIALCKAQEAATRREIAKWLRAQGNGICSHALLWAAEIVEGKEKG